MQKISNGPEGRQQKHSISVDFIEGISRIAVRPVVAGALLLAAASPAQAEAAPSKLTKKQRLEQTLENHVKSHQGVKFINGILRIQTPKKSQSTGGAEAFMPLHPPESEGMADDGEISPFDRFDEDFVNRPLRVRGKAGTLYVGKFTRKDTNVDVKLRKFNPKIMTIMEDQTGHGETRTAVFPTTNDVFTVDLDIALNKMGGKPYLDANGQPQKLGLEMPLDMD